jgi:surface protein
MVSPHTVHLRNLLNTFNSILDGGIPPLDILQNQIAEFEKNFTAPIQTLTLYIDIPKEESQTPFIRSTFTLASHHPLIPPGLRLEVDCPCIDMGLSGVILPRGVGFSASTTSTPPTRKVSFSLQECKRMDGKECKINPDPHTLRVSRYVQAKDCKGMDEKECKNNPDICIYRSFKGGKRGCAARPGTLKNGALNPPLPYTSRDLLEEFKHRVLDYLPDLIGKSALTGGKIHTLPHDVYDLTPYTYLEVVKRFTITEDTKFSVSIRTIVGGPVNLVGDMTEKFHNRTHFNSPVDRWDTSRITNMNRMFWGARAFNQPLEKWNVAGVTDMSSMFFGAKAFNQPLGQWNVSGVENMNNMFFGSTAFNQPLAGWNTSRVTDMSYMFQEATAFNQPLERWDVGGVVYMISMFSDATAFNQPLKGWNTSRVTDMSYMFDGSGMEIIPQWYTDFYSGYW